MSPILLCIHGWGGSKQSFSELRSALRHTNLEILTPDLPGFGDEPQPADAWDTTDYARWVTDWLIKRYSQQELKDRGLMIIGHSHGGRVAIVLVAKQMLPVTHLYLCATAGISRTGSAKRGLGNAIAKTGRAVFGVPGLSKVEPLAKKILYKALGVHDYEKASPIMRETMKKVIEEDLKPLLGQISVPTDIFWGKDDTQTPVADAKTLEEMIPQAHAHVYPGVRHAVHRERAPQIADVIKTQL